MSAEPDAVTSKTVRLAPVYDSDPNSPNYSFSKATPCGLLQLTITNPTAYDIFEEDAEYDILITKRVTMQDAVNAASTDDAPTDRKGRSTPNMLDEAAHMERPKK